VHFARSQLRRTKTDRVDAEMIAEFCKTQNPDRWSPPAPEILEIRGLLSFRAQLLDDKLRLSQMISQIHVSKELHRLYSTQVKTLNASIAAAEKQLKTVAKTHRTLHRQVQKLTGVKGVALLTALEIIAKLPVERLRDGKAAAAYVGLTPRERQSGTSIHGQPHICKTGNASLRRALYMPAIVATRFNPILKAFADRLKAKGKPAKLVVVAVMRKLVVLAFAILNRDLKEVAMT
jgi:transposase